MENDAIMVLKRQLADEIVALAEPQALLGAARRYGIGVSRMCDLRHGRIARFSLERLIRILATVDRRVELRIVLAGPEPICWFPQLRAQLEARREKLRLRAAMSFRAVRARSARGGEESRSSR